ncbi:MAG: hypothetical protein EOP48_27700 [Sphingobacteriales bacterium]|nr:MAG: hypothetical protein EOP48_27700 [Sphingobacteriales bacterium]
MPTRIFDARNMFIGALVSAVLMTLINFAFIDQGIMSYRQDALGGRPFNGLPIVVPFLKFLLIISGLFLYAYLNKTIKMGGFEKYSFAVSNMLLGLCIAFGFFTNSRPYTLTTFVILFLLLIAIEYVGKIRFMGKFYRAFIAFVVPYWLINFILITQNIFAFDAEKRVKFNMGLVPIENIFMGMVMLLIAVFVYERLGHPKKYVAPGS